MSKQQAVIMRRWQGSHAEKKNVSEAMLVVWTVNMRACHWILNNHLEMVFAAVFTKSLFGAPVKFPIGIENTEVTFKFKWADMTFV